MHVVNVSDLGKGYEGRTLFQGVTFGIDVGDRIAVVGRNGTGKSTLLRLVAGQEEPDEGRVVANSRAKITYLPQDPTYADGLLVGDVAAPADDPTIRQHEVEALLDRLGLDPRTEVASLSGGQRRRAGLAAALLPNADLIVLDEPTNHLDVGTIDWLEDELRARTTALLMVTHDRYFLERLTTRILEIDHGAIHQHDGTYSDVLEARAEREALRERREQRRQNLLRKEVAWLRRGPKARTSKPKFRLEQVERLRRAAQQPDELQLDLGTGRRRLGSDVLEVEDLRVGYGRGPVLEAVSLGFGPGDRAAIVGPNGSGKTTLLRVLAGELEPDAGAVHRGKTVEIGYYRQEHPEPPRQRKVIDTITDIAEWIPLANGERLPAARLAERFGFDDRLQHAAVARLSGGERRRLALLHVLVAAPNVLLLDEPTNDLDLDTLRVLEDHLDGFAGTLVVASHDRYLLDRTCDVVYGLEPDGSVSTYLDFEQYHEARLAKERELEAARQQADTGGDSAERNRRRQERMREVRSLEGRMERCRDERDRLHEALAQHATDPERLVALQRELDGVEQELAQLEERWLELTVDD